jgi:ribonuclease HI
MVVVVEDEEFEARKGPVINAKKTNNTAEVMAVQQAIRWAVEQNQSVRIRYDSEYAEE